MRSLSDFLKDAIDASDERDDQVSLGHHILNRWVLSGELKLILLQTWHKDLLYLL